MSRILPIIAVALLTVSLSACGGDEPASAPPATLAFEATDLAPLPAPTDEVLLTIEGGDNPNAGEVTEVDLAGIESLGTTTVTIFEPFIDADLEVTGVAVDRLLASAGIEADDELRWTAINEFEITGTARDLSSDGALIVTRVEGDPIEIGDGGPIRLVFSQSDGPVAQDTYNWIWSIERIEVE